jgi:hypothetical protein
MLDQDLQIPKLSLPVAIIVYPLSAILTLGFFQGVISASIAVSHCNRGEEIKHFEFYRDQNYPYDIKLKWESSPSPVLKVPLGNMTCYIKSTPDVFRDTGAILWAAMPWLAAALVWGSGAMLFLWSIKSIFS